MPKLKQIECSIELGPRNVKLNEYGAKYDDGHVETFIAVPDTDIPFTIHIKTEGYIAPGLAFFAFMDGEYQCNRNRIGFKVPGPGVEPAQYEAEFRLRQKEEKTAYGSFVSRDWTFKKLQRADADKAPHLNPQFLNNIGSVEVVALRCTWDDGTGNCVSPRGGKDTYRSTIPNFDGSDEPALPYTLSPERFSDSELAISRQTTLSALDASPTKKHTTQPGLTSDGVPLRAVSDRTPGSPALNAAQDFDYRTTLGPHLWTIPNQYSDQQVYTEIRSDMHTRAGIKSRVLGCLSGVTDSIMFCDPPVEYGNAMKGRPITVATNDYRHASPTFPEFFPCEFDPKKPIWNEVERIRTELGEVPELTQPIPRQSAKLYKRVEDCRKTIEDALKEDVGADTTQDELTLTHLELELEYSFKVESMPRGRDAQDLHDQRQRLAREIVNRICENPRTSSSFRDIHNMLNYLHSIWEHHYDLDFSPAFKRLMLFQRLCFHDSWLQIESQYYGVNELKLELYKHLWARARRLKWFSTNAKMFQMPADFDDTYLKLVNQSWERLCLEAKDVAEKLFITEEFLHRFPRFNDVEMSVTRATIPNFDGAGDDPRDARGGRKSNVRFKSQVTNTPPNKNYVPPDDNWRPSPTSSVNIKALGGGTYDPRAGRNNHGGYPAQAQQFPPPQMQPNPPPLQQFPPQMQPNPPPMQHFPPHMPPPGHPPPQMQQYPTQMRQYMMPFALPGIQMGPGPGPQMRPPPNSQAPPFPHPTMAYHRDPMLQNPPVTMLAPPRNSGSPPGRKGPNSKSFIPEDPKAFAVFWGSKLDRDDKDDDDDDDGREPPYNPHFKSGRYHDPDLKRKPLTFEHDFGGKGDRIERRGRDAKPSPPKQVGGGENQGWGSADQKAAKPPSQSGGWKDQGAPGWPEPEKGTPKQSLQNAGWGDEQGSWGGKDGKNGGGSWGGSQKGSNRSKHKGSQRKDNDGGCGQDGAGGGSTDPWKQQNEAGGWSNEGDQGGGGWGDDQGRDERNTGNSKGSKGWAAGETKNSKGGDNGWGGGGGDGWGGNSGGNGGDAGGQDDWGKNEGGGDAGGNEWANNDDNATNNRAGEGWGGSVRSHKSGSKASTSKSWGQQSAARSSGRHSEPADPQLLIKPYWKDWTKPFDKTQDSDAGGPRTLHAEPRPVYHYPETPLPPMPSGNLKDASHAIQAGKGTDYAHLCRRPTYIDSMDAPYAVFSFKYRSRDVLEKILKMRVDDEVVERVKKQVEMDQLLELPKHRLVEELLAARK